MLTVLIAVFQFEQQINITFLFKLQKSAAQTLVALSMLYGDKALKKSTMYD
jgi:hypothetical protein